MNSVVLLLIWCVLLFLSLSCLGQTEPYYKELASRDKRDLRIVPNLDAKKTRFYIGSTLDFRFQNSKVTTSGNSRFESSSNRTVNYSGFAGVNFNDNWYYDIAISPNPIVLKTKVNDVALGRQSLFLNGGGNFTSYTLSVRKRVWQIDKVTKNAALLLTGGLSVTPSLGNTIHNDRSFSIPLSSNFGGTIRDTANYSILTQSENALLTPELGIEVSGKIVEQLEIGIFLKSTYRSKKSIYNELSFNFNDEPSSVERQILSPIEVNFGFVLRWNMINWINYEVQQGKKK